MKIFTSVTYLVSLLFMGIWWEFGLSLGLEFTDFHRLVWLIAISTLFVINGKKE